jgi:hypothetical protein
LRAVEASKCMGFLTARDSDGGPHMAFAEHREVAESEKRERWRPHKPVDLKRAFAKRESTDAAMPISTTGKPNKWTRNRQSASSTEAGLF